MTTTPEVIARLFHETYERLAPDFGYRTRDASAKPWDNVPATNKALMVATITEVLASLDGRTLVPESEIARLRKIEEAARAILDPQHIDQSGAHDTLRDALAAW